MTLNIVGEYVALVFALIILFYARDSDMIPTLKNRLFQSCLYVVCVSIALTILCLTISGYPDLAGVPDGMVHVLNILFYLATPLTAVCFLLYMIAYIRDEGLRMRGSLVLATVPYALYAVLVLTDPLTGLVYRIAPGRTVVMGPGHILVYATVYLYVLAMIAVILWFGRRLDKSFRLVLLSFPLAAVAIVVVQEVLENVVLIGTASTSALLLVYLFLQNKRIFVDELTGFKNRKAFSKMVEIHLRRQQAVVVTLVSLDDFRTINSKHGQAFGDEVLREIARFLATLAPVRSIYRFGGDEFALITPRVGPELLPDPVNAIRERFAQPWKPGPASCRLSASLAVVGVPADADTVGDIIGLLEHCVAQSKRVGKGRLVLPDSETLHRIRRRSRIVELLREAIEARSLTLAYQPILAVEDARFHSCEALARLRDPELGQVPPKEFIPIAEETGLIVELGYLVLEEVCRFIHRLEEEGVAFESVSVNFSSIQMFQEGMVERVLEILRDQQVDPRKIHIELTESVFIDRVGIVRRLMLELQAAGLSFDLDDFGTGYSNLSTVIELPFRMVKLDKSLLYDAQRNPRTFTMMKAVAEAFVETGLQVVVEGVETEAHRGLVDRLPCHSIQGYLYARPMPIEAAIAHLART